MICSQSFQWFDGTRALPEFHRVLRAGGRIALLRNAPDKTDAFTAAYVEIMRRAREAARRAGKPILRTRSTVLCETSWFADARTLRFPNRIDYDWRRLRGRCESVSYFPTAGGLREVLLAELRRTFDAHARDGHVTLERWTELVLAERAETVRRTA